MPFTHAWRLSSDSVIKAGLVYYFWYGCSYGTVSSPTSAEDFSISLIVAIGVFGQIHYPGPWVLSLSGWPALERVLPV